ncbi:MAG TPA: hypothetical protein VNV66_16600, partial [Pilimelia sp.]|nr:hypothetical protein [Pilimelia sp.]
ESIDAIVTEVREMTELTIEVANIASGDVEEARTRFKALDAGMADAVDQVRRARGDAARDVGQGLGEALPLGGGLRVADVRGVGGTAVSGVGGTAV